VTLIDPTEDDLVPTLHEALVILDVARKDREDALLRWSRAKSDRIKLWRDALLNSSASTVTGNRHDAEIATASLDALIVELEAQLKIAEGRVHYAATLIAALTSGSS
jgi:hypothetical protein